MVPRLQNSGDFLLVSVVEFVFDPNLTLSFRNEIQEVILVSSSLVLLTEDELWCLQHGLHPLYDVVSELLIVVMAELALSTKLFGKVILHNAGLEDLDLAKDTIGERDSLLHEVIQLLLKRRSGISGDEELNDLTPQSFRDVERLHSCVHRVHLLLEISVLLVQLVDEQRHVSDDQPVDDGTEDEDRNGHQNLKLGSWADFAHTEEIVTDVQTDGVSPAPCTTVVVVYLWLRIPDEVHVWNPDLFLHNNAVPKACHPMDVEDHHEDQESNFASSFDLLARVKVQNNRADFEDPEQLKHTQE